MELVKSGPGTSVALVGSLEADAVPFKACLRNMCVTPPESVALMIGPEGDFTSGELAAARGKGAIPVSYGARVLRVETAALYGLSALAYEFS